MPHPKRRWKSARHRPDSRVEILDKATPFDGYFQVDVYTFRHRRFDGRWTSGITREVFERGHAASVLPYDPVRDAVVLVEQFRAGAYAAGLDPWLVEAVAGIIDDDEPAEDVVRREAVEEAGVDIERIEEIGRFIMTPGGSSETLHMFCGEVDSREAGGHFGVADEGEDIRAFVLPAQEAFKALEQKRFSNMNVVASLQWLALNHVRLRRLWAP